MKKEALKLLTKDELAEIIMQDSYLKFVAFRKVLSKVEEKIHSIIDEMVKCDLLTTEGYAKYCKLEREYEKWSKIQLSL